MQVSLAMAVEPLVEDRSVSVEDEEREGRVRQQPQALADAEAALDAGRRRR
jgi:hypothetical protein